MGRVATCLPGPSMSSSAGGRPRVTHVITSLEEGGAQAMLCKILAAQGDARRAARVVTLTDGGPLRRELAELGVPVVALGMKRGRPSATAVLRLLRILRANRPDVVQTWMYHADLLGGLAASVLRIPVVWGVRHDRLLAGDSALTRLTRRLCSALSWWIPERIVCNSEAARATHARAGYAPEKLLVIPNGFDLSTFRPSAAARRSIRRELGVSDRSPLVGLIARFHPHKDHATFFRAASRIRGEVEGVQFVLCGEGIRWDNPEILELVDGAGLRGCVHLLGRRGDVETVTAALDVACLTSRTESFPNVVGEAMACGVPCVSTDCGDVREILGRLGRVVAIGDFEAVARGVVELLRLHRQEREAIGAVARRRVAALYGMEVVSRRFQDVHDEARASRVVTS